MPNTTAWIVDEEFPDTERLGAETDERSAILWTGRSIEMSILKRNASGTDRELVLHRPYDSVEDARRVAELWVRRGLIKILP